MNVFNSLKNTAQSFGNKKAIIHKNSSITYAELYSKAEDLKQVLIANGVKKGCAISIIFPNSIDFVLTLIACVGTGATVMPIYHHQKENEIEDAIKSGKIHYYLTKDEKHNKHANSAINIKANNDNYILNRTARNLENLTAEFIKHPAFMRFTSGTTGKAKGVIISHQSVIERVDSANEVLQLNSSDNVLWVLPMAFHFVVSIILYLKYGCTIVINDSFLANDIIDSINKNHVTFLYGSPMHIKLLTNSNNPPKLPTLRRVISTTTSIGIDICKSFLKKYKIPVSQAYGIIEIGLPIINTQKSENNPEAVGYSLPAYSVGILDEKFNQLPANEVGLLGIKGPGMFDGYLAPQTLKSEVLKNGWFLTGDYAVCNSEGLITIKGREKNVINVSGNKVFPYEVEDVINSYKGVNVSKAYSKNHLLLGEVVAIDIVQDPDAFINKEELINYSRNYLSDYKVPQIINFVDAIEMTASGKIKRH